MRQLGALIVVLLAVAAAGCGGSDEDPTVAWADGFCSALTTWTASVEGAAAAIKDNPSAEGLQGAVDGVIEATGTLAEDVKALGRPELDAGDQIEETVAELAGSLEEGAATLQETIDQASGAGLTGLLEAVPAITGTFASMANAVGQAFTDLEEVDAKGELEQAFADAESCEPFAG